MADQGARPTAATVFAILHFVFGGLGLFGILGIGAIFSRSAIYGILSLISLGVSGLLVFAGVTLITNKKNALDMNQYYVFASLGVTAITAVYLIIAFGIVGLIGAIFSVLTGLIYPLLVLFLVVKSQPAIEFYGSQN